MNSVPHPSPGKSLQRSVTNIVLGALLLTTSLSRASEADERVAIVARLYHDYAWEVVVVTPRFTPFMDEPVSVLEQYLTPELAALVIQDRECVKRTRETCRMDTSPLWVGNDPGAQDLTVTAGAGNEVVVGFTYPGNGHKLERRFTVVRAGRQWRIDDILFEGSSLKELLKRPQ
jgi:hypothetical protein